MKRLAIFFLLLLCPLPAAAQFRRVGRAVKKTAAYLYTHPPGEHGWQNGVERIPLHLAGFSAPALVGEHYMPQRWAIVSAVSLGAWRAWAEHRDHRQHLDTTAKAWIDWSSQIAGGVVGATAWRR